ncbi:MAG: polymer-forming cytoskeletal protein [Chthoniobacterales bacterium]
MNLNNLTSSLMSDSSTPSSGSNAKNILTNDVSIKGTLEFENELIFDGTIEGEIISEGLLTLGKNAHVEGEVRTKSCVLHGTVVGNISVTERAELKASSELTGDLRAMRIIIEEGATFVGRSEVTPSKAVKRDEGKSKSSPSSSPSDSRSSAPSTSASTASSTSKAATV